MKWRTLSTHWHMWKTNRACFNLLRFNRAGNFEFKKRKSGSCVPRKNEWLYLKLLTSRAPLCLFLSPWLTCCKVKRRWLSAGGISKIHIRINVHYSSNFCNVAIPTSFKQFSSPLARFRIKTMTAMKRFSCRHIGLAAASIINVVTSLQQSTACMVEQKKSNNLRQKKKTANNIRQMISGET